MYNDYGELEDSVSYGVSDPWPSEPCGHGPTLELIDPFIDNALPESWRASILNGSPGTINSMTVNIPEITAQSVYKEKPVKVYPNPFSRILNIFFSMGNNDEAKISVYNMNGELKHIIKYTGTYEGVHNINWDGTDIYGKRLPDGLYLIRIETRHYQSAEKVLLFK
jgi:hypothetical protein